MRIDEAIVREVRLKLVSYFETSFGRTDQRRVILLEVRSGDLCGWGECVAGEGPFFSYETVETAWSILREFLLPVLGQDFENPADFSSAVSRIRGHPMAKACVEAALWDLRAQELQVPLWKILGGTRERIPCGVSIGIQENPDHLLSKIEKELEAGYKKIKIKIKPGWDVEVVRTVREHFPKICLMVDANCAYTLEDAEHLQELDQFNLLVIEQPLAADDLLEHAELQSKLDTPVGLDESVRHAKDALRACQIQACRMVNIKLGRVGGLAEAKRVHDVCRQHGIPVWCGGMLETGIGRAHNIALSTLQNFSVPGDVSASERYYERDTITPPVEGTSDGSILVSEAPGLGYEPDREWIEQITVRKEAVRLSSVHS